MGKKIKVLGIALTMLFSLVGLTACDGDLTQYKTDAKAEITNHVASLNTDEYTLENWTLIGWHVEEGKVAVDVAKNKVAIDTAKTAAITTINGILTKEGEALMQIQARETYLEKILKEKNQAATIDDVSFFHNKFLGIYDGSLVGVFYGGQYHGCFPEVEESVEIAGITFSWSYGYPILVWNDGEIYDLAVAFWHNLLTSANLVTIHELYYSDV